VDFKDFITLRRLQERDRLWIRTLELNISPTVEKHCWIEQE
jgi:hypothetical protein